jgi:hypothetical protein
MAKSVAIFALLFSLLVFVPSQISAEESEAKEFVLTLDNTNFHDTVTKHDFIVVEFYAPWYDSILKFVYVIFSLLLMFDSFCVVLICLICFCFVIDLNFANLLLEIFVYTDFIFLH